MRSEHNRFSMVVLLGFIAVACAGTPNIYPPTPEQSGSLRVAEVVEMLDLRGIPDSNQYFRVFVESGFSPEEVREGRLARGRIYCCGGSTETSNMLLVFVPESVEVNLGDVIEVRMGRAPSNGTAHQVNTAIRVRDRFEGKGEPSVGVAGNWTGRSCRWVPEDPDKWGRILYCDWMEDEGWIEYEGFWHTWHKPASSR